MQLEDQEEIKEYKQKSEKYKNKVANLKLEITKLKDMLNQKEDSAQYDKYTELLGELFNKGIIDHEGSFINKVNKSLVSVKSILSKIRVLWVYLSWPL